MSNILLYPFGAFVSSIVIVSGLVTFVISTVPKSTIPFVPVIFISASFPGNVTWNSAPCNFVSGLSLSTFSSCS